MTLIATEGQKRTPAPEGTHLAICCQVIDLGTQSTTYKGKPKMAHKVVIGWELPNAPNPNDDGKPFLTWNRYTVSLHEKAMLRSRLESWRGRKFNDDELSGFDLKNILGKPCLLNLVHNDGYANVSAVMAIPKGTAIPELSHPIIHFDIDNWDDAVFSTFSDGLKKTICDSQEAIAKFNGGNQGTIDPSGSPTLDDEVPF